MRKVFSAIAILVLLTSGMASAARPVSSRPASAYAPAPPTPPAVSPSATPPSAEPRAADQSFPTPPPPDELPPEMEEKRAHDAIEAVLQKRLDYWGPRYQIGALEVEVEGEWAHGVAEWQSEEKVVDGPIHVLARRDESGAWQALMPSEEGLYLQWVEKVPESLISTSAREKLHRQAPEVDALRTSQSTGPTPPPNAPSTSTTSQDEIAPGNAQSMRNPAAIYCTELGYKYEVTETSDGSQRGVCKLPARASCSAWDFLKGKCGQAYNACAREGLSTVTKRDSDNPFTSEAALCVNADGREVLSAVEAVNLVEKSIGATPSYTTTYQGRSSEPSTSGMQDLATLLSFDWRDYDGVNWMTPIKNQGMCGSCWAFAAVGVAEAVTNIENRDHTLNPDMSEQYLVTDCAVDAGDCNGGWGGSALVYIRDEGIPDESCLPYHDGDTDGCTYDSNGCVCSMCNYCSDTECSDYQCNDRCSDWDSRLYTLARTNFTWDPSRTEIKSALLAHGPLAVSIAMEGEFDNGIYRCDPEPDGTNHGVSIVGYDDFGGYWIVRNSWGTGFGDNGYFKVAYGNCLIENYIYSADLVACNDENELNDSTSFATSISYGQTLSADICSAGDEDFYEFTGAAGDKVVIDIDAQSEGSSLDSYIYLLDSSGNTLDQNNDEYPGSLDSHLGYELSQSGTYYIKVRDYGDDGGTDYPYTIHLLTDAITPTAEIISPEPDSWIDPTTQAVTTDVSDGESGIRNVKFYWHDADWENSDWVVLKDDWDARDGWTYDLDTSSRPEQSQDCVVFIYAYDWAGNQTHAASYHLGIDRTAPNVTPDAYPAYGNAPFRDFWVNWWYSYDSLSGIASYDVQVRDGADGTWTDLVLGTTDTYTTFVGADDHTYYFRARARDHAGNLSAYSTEEVSHTVDICETAADAYENDDGIGSASRLPPNGASQIHNFHTEEDTDWVKFEAQAGVTYTLATANTGDHADTVLELYDADGSTLLAENDDCPGRWPASCLDWQAPSDGTYYVKVYHWDQWAYGCTTEYGLAIASDESPSLTLGEPGTSFRYVETLGEPGTAYPADTDYLNGPNGLFVDGSDKLYVAEELGARLLEYDENGNNLLSIGTAGLQNRGEYTFDHPQDVAVDSGSHIWTVDRHRVAQYDASGNFLQEFPPDDPWNAGDDNSHFDTPRGIAFDSSGRMYVSDSNNHRIQVYTFDANETPVYSTTIGVTGEPGDDDAHFDTPGQIFLNSGDFLYVADVNNHRVQRCSYSGGWSCSTIHGTGSAGGGSDELNSAYGLAEGLGTDGSGDFYIADSVNGRVKECSADMFGWTCNAFVTDLGWPSGVAVDSNGHVYVSDFHDHTIREYDSDGNELNIFQGKSGIPYPSDKSLFNTPHGVAVDSDGSIYLVEDSGYRLIKLNAAGEPQWSVGEAGVYGDDNAHFGAYWRGPTDVALDSSGNVYVADTGNHRIQIFDSGGDYLRTLGSRGSGDDQFQDPYGVAVDSDGNIYVADEENHRVQIHDSDHNYQATLGVTDEAGEDNAHFDHPRGVAVDSAGHVYVADSDNVRVQRCTIVDTSGECETFVGETGTIGDDFAHLRAPLDVAVDAQDRVYVLDSYWNQRVQVFDDDGAYLTTINGEWGGTNGDFRNPEGIGIAPDGAVYVADTINARVQKFALGVPDWQQVNINGFGDKENSGGSVTLHPFDDRLYAGLWHEEGGQLWRTSDGTSWSQITDDGFGNADNSSIELGAALDGFLYAGTWNETSGCEVYRSDDGHGWNPVKTGGFGDANNIGVGAMAVFEDALYVSTYNDATGTEVWRTSDGTTWSRANDDGFDDANNVMGWTMAVFEDRLYVGVQNFDTGAEIWRSADGTTWEQVDEDGLGNAHNQWPRMAVLDDQLYVAFANDSTDSYTGTGTQIWRSGDGEAWEPVIDDGFGDNTNGGSDVLVAFDEALYSATYNPETGTQLHRTTDGLEWTKVAPDGFGDLNNASTYGSAIFDNHLFLATDNEAHGTEIWRYDVGAEHEVYLPLVLRNKQ